ncbi:MAG: polysaccharide deacetylase family protein [Gaiellaceae bacterium]
MTRGPTGLEIAPAPFYAAKAVLTRGRSAAWLLRAGGRSAPDGIRILFYHRVSREKDELAVSPERFARQMSHLADEGYAVVDVLTATAMLGRGRERKTVALSFDDGYLDVAENALPVLAGHGFRATVFVAPAVIDGDAAFEWYDRQPALLDWDGIRELDREGVLSFEAHSLTHPNLLRLGDDDAREEIAGSKAALEARLERPVEAFSYPAGLFGERERRYVIESGFRVAVSCEPGVNDAETDRFALRRRQIDGRDALLDFKAKVGGGHDSPLPLRDLYRRSRFGGEDETPAAASSRR